jgi:nitrite reductase (NO-forming)
MNKRFTMLFTVAAVAVMGATLFGSTYTQTQISGQSLDMSSMDMDMMDKIRNMGGLQLVMPQAFAETDCGVLADTGRNVVEFNLTGESVSLPIMGGESYNAMTFNGQVPGPTLRVTQGDVVKMMKLPVTVTTCTHHKYQHWHLTPLILEKQANSVTLLNLLVFSNTTVLVST